MDAGFQSAWTGTQLLIEFIKETNDIAVERHAQKDEAVLAIVLEQNRKWNAIIALFGEHDCRHVLKRNGFRDHMAFKIPGLRTLLMEKRAAK